MSGRLFTAEIGEGAFLNGEPIGVSTVESFDTLVIDFEDPRQESLANGSFRTRLKRRGVLVQTLWSSVYAYSPAATRDDA